ncbi:wall-associated receptor kinase 2-like protein [Corchorus olitorius]|uniref:Wall-associated receptor kinase 2-like protein n=1 Tax=Corchorus olitorius TaxID=93759 RepID=A0A1R3GTE4_9ROSI|nr:wall-associated receptor kinase 2-like protein [Corchorus olitorius]
MAAAQSGTLRELASDFVKLDHFDGGNFRRGQKKMHFLLSTLKLPLLKTPTIAAAMARREYNFSGLRWSSHARNLLHSTFQTQI